MSQELKNSTSSILTWLIILVLTICNVLLIRQNLQLRSQIESVAKVQELKIGDKVDSFRAQNLYDKIIEIDYHATERKKVFMFLITSCIYCDRQTPYWREFIRQIDIQKYEIFAVFTDKEDKGKILEYLNSHGYANGELVQNTILLPSEILQKYKLNSTPTTLVVSEDGIVENNWIGLWGPKKISEVNSLFGTSIQMIK